MAVEKDLQLYITKRAHSLGMLCYKFESPSKRGVPDLLVATKKGVVFFIEVKHPDRTGRVSESQKAVFDRFREQELRVYVVETRDEADTALAEELN
jgi:hypothetical protein